MIGKILRGRYEITQNLGEGPVFITYSATDRTTHKEVCVRVLKPPFSDERALVDALRSAVAKLAPVKDAGVERILEVDVQDGAAFLAGELSSGTPLSDRIRKFAPFSVPVALTIAISIGDALHALHEAGVVHGDLGAHNIAVLTSGNTRLQLSGVWNAYSASKTAGIVVLPTMAPYLAPEVSRGEMPSASSDIYSLGVILFQLLTGRLPYVADQPIALAMKHAIEPIPSARLLNASIPVALEDVIKKALAKDPTSRYASVETLVEDLEIIQDGLRFGKAVRVTSPEPEADEPEQEEDTASVSPFKKLSGIKIAFTNAASSAEQDVPMWLRMALVFFLSLVTFMIGGWIVFNLNKPRTVDVPDVRRLSIVDAESRLKPLGLKIRVVGRRANETVGADLILDTDPTAGSKVVEGYTLDAVLSMGSRTVQVPDIRGVTTDRARLMLESVGLLLNDRISEQRNRNIEAGMIISQNPERGARVERGTSVRATVSTGAGPSREEDPQDLIKYLYYIRIRLNDIDEPVVLRVDMTDSRGTKTVHEEEHDPGEEVEIAAEGFGTEAVFRIFYNGDLVKQVTKRANEGNPDQ